MRFDAGRLATLAGLVDDGNSGLISENVDAMGVEEAELIGGAGDDTGDDTGDNGEEAPEESLASVMEMSGSDDEIVEIDENVLRREIMKMKNQKLAETKVRQAIRAEIESILSEEGDDLYSGSSWLYGNNKPKRSRKGSVATGMLGIGFQK
jgi:hypothetical protein